MSLEWKIVEPERRDDLRQYNLIRHEDGYDEVMAKLTKGNDGWQSVLGDNDISKTSYLLATTEDGAKAEVLEDIHTHCSNDIEDSKKIISDIREFKGERTEQEYDRGQLQLALAYFAEMKGNAEIAIDAIKKRMKE